MFCFKDVSDKKSLECPKLYLPGQKNILFNKMTFARKLVHGTITSCVLFFFPFCIYNELTNSEGLSHDMLTHFAVAVGALLVIVVNLQVSFLCDVCILNIRTLFISLVKFPFIFFYFILWTLRRLPWKHENLGAGSCGLSSVFNRLGINVVCLWQNIWELIYYQSFTPFSYPA